MKTYTEQEVQTFLKHLHFDLSHVDNDGQVIIYTGVFLWKDGAYRDQAQGTTCVALGTIPDDEVK